MGSELYYYANFSFASLWKYDFWSHERTHSIGAAGHKDQNYRSLEELQIPEDLIIERNKLLIETKGISPKVSAISDNSFRCQLSSSLSDWSLALFFSAHLLLSVLQ